MIRRQVLRLLGSAALAAAAGPAMARRARRRRRPPADAPPVRPAPEPDDDLHGPALDTYQVLHAFGKS